MSRLAVVVLLAAPAVAPAQGFNLPYRTGSPFFLQGGFAGGFNPMFRVPYTVPYGGIGYLSPGGFYDAGFYTTYGPNVYFIPSFAGAAYRPVAVAPPPLVGAGAPAPAAPTVAPRSAAGQVAELRLELPAPADLWVDGKQQAGKEASRTLTSAALPAGGSHTFQLKATWTAADGSKYEWERSLSVAAGARSRLVVASGSKTN